MFLRPGSALQPPVFYLEEPVGGSILNPVKSLYDFSKNSNAYLLRGSGVNRQSNRRVYSLQQLRVYTRLGQLFEHGNHTAPAPNHPYISRSRVYHRSQAELVVLVTAGDNYNSSVAGDFRVGGGTFE